MTPVDILFVHNNFPGQFRAVAGHLAAQPEFRVFAIGAQTARALPGVTLATYTAPRRTGGGVHPFAASFDGDCRRAEEVIFAANALVEAGMAPRIVFVHPGWGESLPLRRLFPHAKIVVYGEFFYRTAGADVGFDPESPHFGVDGLTRIALRNASTLLAFADADAAVSPTEWQRSTFPADLRHRIAVIPDGVETGRLHAQPAIFAHRALPRPLATGDEVLTYVARGLEPYRGFHVFMRALPAILKARPNVTVCIAGSDRVCYGTPPDGHPHWRAAMLAELGTAIDPGRVFFLGPLKTPDYLNLLRVSRAHAYLTYPFVLSWSLTDAMAMGAVVVASDTAPVRDVIVDGETGLLVPFLDPDRLAARLVDVLVAPERFAGIGRRARDRVVERFDFSTRTLPAYLGLIRDLLAAPRADVFAVPKTLGAGDAAPPRPKAGSPAARAARAAALPVSLSAHAS